MISSIPTYFKNKESPIIVYKYNIGYNYNQPISSMVSNYNKLVIVIELDIETTIYDS